MINNFIYVPILQTKRGEFTALAELSDTVKNHIKPLFVLTKNECEARATSLGDNLSKKWTNRSAYIDLTQSPTFAINGQDSVDYVFNDLVARKIDFTPVISVDNQNQRIIAFILNHGLSACIRIDTQTLHGGTHQHLNNLINILAQTGRNIDVLINFGENTKPTRQAHAQDIANYLTPIQQICENKVQKIIIAASSLPVDLPRANYNPYGFEPRIEWLGFSDFMSLNFSNNQNAIFSDYSVTHPTEQEPIDYVNPNAKIRYTISDNYMFAVGYQVHTHADGFNQYHDMAALIVNSPYFVGTNYSWGDKYLFDCANRSTTCGNMETWVKVGHNHHITFVVGQLSNQYGISI